MTPPPSRRPDHPRSRGVYRPFSLACAFSMGSSPLARGLRRREPDHDRHRRIIPARAGFTTAPRYWPARPADHPRSRGVYEMHLTGTFSRTGSSPLARGLPSHHDRRASSGRIIPARAGFTRGAFWPRPRSRDHPRSRGVYEMCLTGAFSREGSSPLARGLRRRCRRPHSPDGIIPARAGFTAWPPAAAVHGGDHPRSRGVYYAA